MVLIEASPNQGILFCYLFLIQTKHPLWSHITGLRWKRRPCAESLTSWLKISKKNFDNKWLLFYTFTVEMIFLYLKSFSPIVHDCITITVNFGISMAFGTFQRILTYIISLCALCSFCPFYTSQSWVCKKCILLNKWWTSWWALTFVMLQNPGAPLVGTMHPQQLLHPVIPFC